MKEEVLTLKDMTRGSGCTPRTVRYYERQGLLRALRSTGGHRLFAVSELERLRLIINLREAGWPLEEVVAFLEVRDGAASDAVACGALAATLAARLDDIDKKIAQLEQLRLDLRATAALLPTCGRCTREQTRVDCETCGEVPALQSLPQAFRVVWRGRELEGAHLYEREAAAHDDEDVAEDQEVSR